jgi:hypothetical protein
MCRPAAVRAGIKSRRREAQQRIVQMIPPDDQPSSQIKLLRTGQEERLDSEQ